MKHKVISSFRIPPLLSAVQTASHLPAVIWHRHAAATALLALVLSGFSAHAANVTLAWNRSSATNLASYRLHYGTASRSYSASLPVGAGVTNATVSNLLGGQTYYFAVTASNTAGLQSAYSTEVAHTVPVTNAAPVTNIAPVAIAQNVTTAEGTAKLITLTGTDANSNPLTYAVVTSPTHGTLSGTAPNLTYTPTAGYTGTDSFTFRVNDGTASSAAATVGITVTAAASGVPAPWLMADIGSGILAGRASVTNSIFTVEGAGAIGGLSDNCRFVYQPMIGSGEIRVRLTAAQFSDPKARVGVMIRENLSSGARCVFLGLASDGMVRLQSRYLAGTPATSTLLAGGSLPVWLRLVRTDGTITAYQSTDGKKWTRLRIASIGMAANTYVGFAVGSGTTSRLDRATFDLSTVVP